MALTEILLSKRDTILEKWLQEVLESYPDQSRHFLRQVKDPFANPVGATLFQALATVLDGLLSPSDSAASAAALGELIKIRAVQGLEPSRALAFLFKLKQIAREAVEKEIANSGAPGPFFIFDAKVDELALGAFDLYAANREKICAIRIGEMKRSLFVIERASRPLDAPGPDSGPEARIPSDTPTVSIPSGGIIGNEPKP
jgi:hypothetical protein